MVELDPKVIERIANIICDLGGPFEKRGWELERLLRHAGWMNPPTYDGTPRIPWLRHAMESAEPADVERLICRVCHPLEYEDGMASAEIMRDAINQVLGLQGLAVSYLGGCPVIGRRGGGDSLIYSAPDNLESRLPALIDDPDTVAWLLARVKETQICEANGAYVFALVGIGSFVEYLLLSVLRRWDPEIRQNGFTNEAGKVIPFEKVSLDHLIKTAHTKGFIQVDRRDFMDLVRRYRNLVHLRLQSEKEINPDPKSVMMCWAPVSAVLSDLETAVNSRRQSA